MTDRVRFSTDDLPPDQRFSVWSQGVVHRQMAMEFIDRSDGDLRFAIEFIPLGGVAAGTIRGTPSSFIRKPVDGNDGLYMVINRCGRFDVVQQGVRHTLAVGAAAVFDNRCPGELHCVEAGETWSISVPREALRHLVSGIEKSIERVIPAGNAMVRMLAGYLETLFALEEIDEPALAGVHIADLVASVIGARCEAQALIDERGVRAARLRAVLDAIAGHAGDIELDPAGLAERLGLSVRYLHLLLEDTGKTFSEHLLERRLERAHRLLRDPRLGNSKISSISQQAGFADLSHFNRSFRRRFGETPSAARAAASRKENG